MKHALSTQTVGGVMLTAKSTLVRTVNVNLAAARELRGATDEQTKALQEYILALALVSATSEPDLNLREGCNLRFKGEPIIKLVYRSKDDQPITLDATRVEEFAEAAAKAFFKIAKINFENKDHTDVTFETSVAEDFLSRSSADRKKISQLGPINAATLKQFDEQGKDPFKLVADGIKAARETLGRAPKRNAPRIKSPEALRDLIDALKATSENATLPETARSLAGELLALAQNHDDSHAAINEVEKKIREFRKAQKAERDSAVDAAAASEASQ